MIRANRVQPSTPKVLVVGSEADRRVALAKALVAMGWEVVEASTGAEAPALVRRSDPDVVLMDLGITDGDGLATLSELKRFPEISWTPVIVRSGPIESAGVAGLLRAGAQDHIADSCSIDELEARLSAGRRVTVEHRLGMATEVRYQDLSEVTAKHKSDFLATISHEMRTPMNGVIGMIELLLETELEEIQRDYAETVRHSGEVLMVIINEILDFARIADGKVQSEHVEFDIESVVGEVADLLAVQARDKALEIITSIDDSVPRTFEGDPGRLRQVLTNLIGNGIKFTGDGEVVVRASAPPSEPDTTVIRFDISDSGDGIPAEKLAMIFQPFVQADSSPSRKYGGTGLGLAISSQLVEMMGGECGVSSQVGTGSNFWFTVVGPKRLAGHGRVTPAGGDGFRDAKVLVVDDSAACRNVLSGDLARWGLTVGTAESGEAALAEMRDAVAADKPYRVVIVDQMMSGMNGAELVEAVVADPALSVRVLMMTTVGQEIDVLATGICALAPKPIHRSQLRASLRIALDLPPEADSGARGLAPSATGEHRSGHLLVAEDNLLNQKIAVAMLSGAGYLVDVVASGTAAVSALAAQPFDAILMDCHMPEMDGYQATAAIRAHEGTSRHTPIIAMTAGARREDRDRCLAEGMDSYIAKPIGKLDLLAVVATSIDSGLATMSLHERSLTGGAPRSRL